MLNKVILKETFITSYGGIHSYSYQKYFIFLDHIRDKMSMKPLATNEPAVDMAQEKKSKLLTIWWVVAGSAIIFILSIVLGYTIFNGNVWPNVILHTAVEAGGSVTAIIVAVFLINIDYYNRGTDHNHEIACGLIVIGILDGAHALVQTGQLFVWLHSLSIFIGGLILSTIILPDSWRIFRFKPMLTVMMIFSLAISLGSIAYQQFIPTMLEFGKFTNTAVFLNVLGGVLFFVATVSLIKTYRSTGNIDNLIFCLHCGLFGAAAILFQQSSLWDTPWWGWHVLRALAYAVALWLLVREATVIMNESIFTNNRLEETVVEMSGLQHKLIQNNSELKQKEKRIRQLMLSDPLTDLPNRRAFDDRAKQEIRRSIRSNDKLYFAIGDIDHFKQINDNHGHEMGDNVLKLVAKRMVSEIRSHDFVARYGGEEFIFILPMTNLAEAKKVLARISSAVNTACQAEFNIPLTLSYGLAKMTDKTDLNGIIKMSDIALYYSKQNGRNQITLFDKTISNHAV